MKLSIAATAIATLAASTNAAYTLTASKTDSNGRLDYTLAANDYRFWINKATASYCPAQVDAEGGCCPAGDVTSFETGDKHTSLNVEVPGGQEVFIKKNGIVSYTVPHSGVIPNGARTLGVKEVLLGDRVWLCNDMTEKGYSAEAFFLTVAATKKASPQQARTKGAVCTRVKLEATHLKSHNATAWEYV